MKLLKWMNKMERMNKITGCCVVQSGRVCFQEKKIYLVLLSLGILFLFYRSQYLARLVIGATWWVVV